MAKSYHTMSDGSKMKGASHGKKKAKKKAKGKKVRSVMTTNKTGSY